MELEGKHADSNHFQLENCESFLDDLKAPEFGLRKPGGNSKAVLLLRVGHLCMYHLILRVIPPNDVRNFHRHPYGLGPLFKKNADSIGVLNTFHLGHGRC